MKKSQPWSVDVVVLVKSCFATVLVTAIIVVGPKSSLLDRRLRPCVTCWHMADKLSWPLGDISGIGLTTNIAKKHYINMSSNLLKKKLFINFFINCAEECWCLQTTCFTTHSAGDKVSKHKLFFTLLFRFILYYILYFNRDIII